MPTQALPYLLLTGFFFGTGLLSARFATNQFEVATYAGLRLILASLGYLGLYWFCRARYPWPNQRVVWAKGFLLGLISEAIPMVASTGSLQYLSSGVVSIFVTTGPAITIVLAHFLLADEALTLQRGVGVVITLSGALLLALRGESGLPEIDLVNPFGYALIIVAVISLSLSNIYVRKFMPTVSFFDLAGIQTFAAAVWVFPLVILLDQRNLQAVNWQGYTALLYGVVGSSLIGALLFFTTVQRFGAATSALVHFVTPVVVTVGGVLLLNEQITSGILGGIALVGVGIGIIFRQEQLPPEMI